MTGPFPSFEFDSESGAVKVTPCGKYDDYATISHVWADGYGNPKSNELNLCQLKFFAKIFNKIRTTYMPQLSTERLIPFWIDSLAIPVGDSYKEQRKRAIGRIHEIFCNAKYTIVIDNGLIEMEEGTEYHEGAMKILASGWMRRLWTLQEAYLSKQLFFSFRHNVVNLDGLEDMFPKANDTLASNIPATARSYFHGLLGTDRKARIHEIGPKHGFGLLASVWKATQWRTTSHPEHETLALATLLNVDASNFADAGLVVKDKKDVSNEIIEGRMKMLWSRLDELFPGSIPAGVIFLPSPRLSLPGFGWAPKTWMSGREVEYPDPLSMIAKPGRLIAGKGLLVEYPGFLLHSENMSSIMMDEKPYFRFPSDNTLHEWYTVSKADSMVEASYEGDRGKLNRRTFKPFAIILSRQRPRAIPEIGLLVEIDDHTTERVLGEQKESKIFNVSIVFRVSIKRDVGEDLLRNWEAHLRSPANGSDNLICGEVLDADQKWCVGQKRTATISTELQSSRETGPTTTPEAVLATPTHSSDQTRGHPKSNSGYKQPVRTWNLFRYLKSSDARNLPEAAVQASYSSQK